MVGIFPSSIDIYELSDPQIGSGLTRKQRTLVIIIMILFCYICFGALINSLLQELTFINGLYFTLVTIETIGFGDIVPETTGSRVFICAYSSLGLLNLGVAIGKCREMVLEAMEVGYRKCVRKTRERWKESRKRRRLEARWIHAIERRLREIGVPVWVCDENRPGNKAGERGRGTNGMNCPSFLSRAIEWTGFGDSKIGRSQMMHGPTGMRLNLNALSHVQLEASALDAGAPLDTFLPSDFIPASEEENGHMKDVGDGYSTSAVRVQYPLAPHLANGSSATQACTHSPARLSNVSALPARFGVNPVHKNPTITDEPLDKDGPSNGGGTPVIEAACLRDTSNNLQAGPSLVAKVDKGRSHLNFKSTRAHLSDNSDLQTMQNIEKKRAFRSKLIVSWILFFTFWTVSDRLYYFV